MSDDTATRWEAVIGLEVHVELATATKMFCGCPNVFGSEPNTNVCPTCLGLPGSLPVVNEKAVELAAALGLALGCDAYVTKPYGRNTLDYVLRYVLNQPAPAYSAL